jgi:hypothetical protein
MLLKKKSSFKNAGATGELAGTGQACPSCTDRCLQTCRWPQFASMDLHRTDDAA